jgi:TonB family protein
VAPDAPYADSIRSVMRERGPGFRQCYEHELRVCPNLQQKVILELVIAPDGSVLRASAESSDGNQKLARCVADVAKTMRFMVSGWREPMRIRYPIVFAPGG